MKKRLVIVGGGFVGTRVAVQTAKKHPNLEVILLSTEERFSFSPLLIDVLAGDLMSDANSFSLREVALRHHFIFLQGEVLTFNRNEREIHYRSGSGKEEVLVYDLAVLATGSKVNYYNIPGAERLCLSLKTPLDPPRIWQRVQEKIAEKQGSLSIAVIGGGPTGIEALYALKTYLQRQNIEQVAVHLFEATPSVLPGFDPAIQQQVTTLLRKDGIHLHIGKAVQKVEASEIILTDLGIQYDIALWCAGIQPHLPALIPPINGPLTTDQYLRLDEQVFVGGDVALIEKEGKRLPKTGQAALHVAEIISQNIQRHLSNQPLLSITFPRSALLLSLGKTGIIHVGTHTFQTSLTAFLRRSLYRLRRWQMWYGW